MDGWMENAAYLDYLDFGNRCAVRPIVCAKEFD